MKIWNQWYGIPERQPTSTVAMIFAKKTKKLINHAQKFILIMVKPQHSRNTASTSRLTDQRSSQQQQQIDRILEEYHNIFQAPNRETLHSQVKHSFELVPGSSLPNAFVYRRSILENEEIHRKIQNLIDKGHILPSSSPCGSLVILVPKKYGT